MFRTVKVLLGEGPDPVLTETRTLKTYSRWTIKKIFDGLAGFFIDVLPFREPPLGVDGKSLVLKKSQTLCPFWATRGPWVA